MEIQSSTELDNLNYSTSGKSYNFNKYLLPTIFLKNLDADVEHSMSATETKNVKRSRY